MESVLAEVASQLRAAGCVFAEEEAAILCEAAAPGGARALPELVRRRAAGEPLEQVAGFANFCGVRVNLRPGVFVPRVRSELLVRVASARLTTRGGTVIDLCCGSGALGLAVTRSIPADLIAADNDPAAVACARDNLGPDRVFAGDLFDPLPTTYRGRADIILANVPYVATRHLPFLPAEARLHEPRTALDGGIDGLDVFRKVVAAAEGWLAPGGLLLSEITEAQAEAATGAVRAAGLRPGLHSDEELAATVVTAERLNR